MTGTGSSKPSNEPEQKEEKQSKDDKDSQDKDLYISVMFSVIPYEMMTSYRVSEYMIGNRKFQGYSFIHSTKPKWENGSFDKNKIDKSMFVDCFHITNLFRRLLQVLGLFVIRDFILGPAIFVTRK